MKFFTAASVCAALLSAFAGNAGAGGVMYSAPVSDGTVYCDIRNAGTSPIEGTIQTISYDGQVIFSGPLNFTLDPEHGLAHSGTGSSCKVTLTKGSVKKVRGVAVYHLGTDGAYTIPIQ